MTLDFVILSGLFIFLISNSFVLSQYNEDIGIPECNSPRGTPKFCRPPFTNAAYKRRVNATNTCGVSEPQEFCGQSGASEMKKVCDTCDDSDPNKRHPPSFITDYNYIGNRKTWWQSDTLNEYVKSNAEFNYLNGFPINLTINLGTQFELTYIRLKFQSVRPSSMVLYRKYNDSSPWEPLQYFSASCGNIFKKRDSSEINSEDEAICVSKYSTLTPLSGGEVVFSFLEGRPGASNFFKNKKLQRWVTATQIRVALIHLNTFGDELYRDPRVLRTYFYAISDISIGGRCHCNGHAARCGVSTGQGDEEAKLYCDCEHNTAGQNCERCKRGFMDVEWQRATPENAHACKPCNCNGNSKTCTFDQALYDFSGRKSGGVCINCKNNTEGAHCETCIAGFNRTDHSRLCRPCNCNEDGSRSNKCDENGQCQCHPGVTGRKCDRCLNDHFQFSKGGCKSCNCSLAGSPNNEAKCDSVTGVCRCKENAEGKQCQRCLPGYFGLSTKDPLGCQPCFCYGHSSKCSSAPGWVKQLIHVPIVSPKWTIVDENGEAFDRALDTMTEATALNISNFISPKVQWKDRSMRKTLYYSLPTEYLGDRRSSYNSFLVVKLSFDSVAIIKPGYTDIRFNSRALGISIPIIFQNNPQLKANTVQTFRFRLNENPKYEWLPKDLSSEQWMGLLNHLTSIKIKATFGDTYYGNQTGRARLHGVWLEGAAIATSPEKDASSNAVSTVEMCDCLPGYRGQFCEDCDRGYRRERLNGGPFSRCLPCKCNNHSETCEVESGKCYCQHNTTGDACEKCALGFYGNALSGRRDACQPCPCPKGHSCERDAYTKEVVCLSCPPGYTGSRCDRCLDGFFGRPPSVPCQLCNCNGNIDLNSIGNCDPITGECLRCTSNTAGLHCERCAEGYFGNATAFSGPKCRACKCHPTGSDAASCDQATGQCLCRVNVEGQRCDRCKRGFYNLESSFGCLPCNCVAKGTLPPANSSEPECRLTDGQCPCRPGVGGRECNKCERGHYNFTDTGCAPCDCHPAGSKEASCDAVTGKCRCRTNVKGDKCNRCDRNRYDFARGCVECPICYGRVMERVNQLQDSLRLVKASSRPRFSNDSLERLEALAQKVSELHRAATSGQSPGEAEGKLAKKLTALEEELRALKPWKENMPGLDATLSKCSTEQMRKQMEGFSQNLNDTLKMVSNEGPPAIKKAKAMAEKYSIDDEMTALARTANNMTAERELMLAALRQKEKTLAKAINNITININRLPNITDEANKVLDEFNATLIRMLDDFNGSELSKVANATTVLAMKALQLNVDVEKVQKSPANFVTAKKLLEAFMNAIAESTRLLEELEPKLAQFNNSNAKKALESVADKMMRKMKSMEKPLLELRKLWNITQVDKMEVEKMYEKLKEINSNLETGIRKNKEAAERASGQKDTVKGHLVRLQQRFGSISAALNTSSNETNALTDSVTKVRQSLSNITDDLAADTPRRRAVMQTAEDAKTGGQETAKKAAAMSYNASQVAIDRQRKLTDGSAVNVSSDKANVTELKEGLEAGLQELTRLMNEMDEAVESNETVWTSLEARTKAVEQLVIANDTLNEQLTMLEEDARQLSEAGAKLRTEKINAVREEENLLALIGKLSPPCGERPWRVGGVAEE